MLFRWDSVSAERIFEETCKSFVLAVLISVSMRHGLYMYYSFLHSPVDLGTSNHQYANILSIFFWCRQDVNQCTTPLQLRAAMWPNYTYSLQQYKLEFRSKCIAFRFHHHQTGNYQCSHKTCQMCLLLTVWRSIFRLPQRVVTCEMFTSQSGLVCLLITGLSRYS